MTAPDLRIVLAQLDLHVGHIEYNRRRIVEAAVRARDEMGADVIVLPELALTGYPPEDLLLRPGLHQRVEAAIASICAEAGSIAVVIGHPRRRDGLVYNSCSVIESGRVTATYDKQLLPNYSVFDEKRYFTPGTRPCVVELKGVRAGLSICEDIWEPGPAAQAAQAGAEVIININASPFHIGKPAERRAMVEQRARETGCAVAYLNLVGGQDELVFDGHSMAIDGRGSLCMQAPGFSEGLFHADLYRGDGLELAAQPLPAPLDRAEAIYSALVLGVRDYVGKNGFKGAVLGLSGGIDSALTLAIAVDAIGADAVEAVLMPSRYTADMSIEDAELQADRLGVRQQSISIEPVVEAFTDSLRGIFAGRAPDTTEENIQARCRGVLLMAISNKTGALLLTTGNKSEMAVGYATLYGDMAGGFAPLKDIAKTTVYELAQWRNRDGEVIPQRVIERPPSAELGPDQKDTDSLPPYPVLDAILEGYVENDRQPADLVADGFSRADVERVVRLVDRNEYKRRQSAPGVRITRRAFGRDRRYPITSGYDELE